MRTSKLGLKLPLQIDEYDVDIFNENFSDIDEAIPRIFIRAREPPEWLCGDVWLEVVRSNEQTAEVILETSANTENAEYILEIDGTQRAITNAVSDPALLAENKILIEKD
jgi:hypothetical protein